MKDKVRGKSTVSRDIVLILALAVVGLGLLLAMQLGGRAGAYAVVELEGSEIARYPLDCDGVFVLNGGTNTLEILGGKARMLHAECPDKLCVKMGWVRFSGQSLVCLPERISVRIVGGRSSVDVVN
ncbi:MAG: NusG domain II-containing protein [Spirochaetales bacterium]|nr:NusG domain II-containing protein [Spirochaetales bacterium]